MKRGRAAVNAMYLVLALLLVQLHAYHVNFSDQLILRAQRHERLLALQGDAPWAYRLLVPACAEILSVPLAAIGLPEDEAREYAYLALRFCFLGSLLVLFDRYCRRFVSAQLALAVSHVLRKGEGSIAQELIVSVVCVA